MRKPGAGIAVPASSTSNSGSGKWFAKPWIWLVIILGGSLLILFHDSFNPNLILFANDTTLGQMRALPNRLPASLAGSWHWGSWLGMEGPAAAPTLSTIFQLLMSPELFLKAYEPLTLLFLGFCAWVFFRQVKLSPTVCVLGGVAAGLNSHFLSVACWGLGSWNIAAGLVFLALAALYATSIPQLWARAILAGLAVGMNLMEAFDVGVILSIYVGLFIVWHAFNNNAPVARKTFRAIGTEALVIFFSALIAAHSISSLIGTEVKGVAELGQDETTKEQRWNPATRWSLPKVETLSLFVPGLFGYRTLQHITVLDKSGSYWGTIGRDTRLEEIAGNDLDKRAEAVKSLVVSDAIKTNLLSNDTVVRDDAMKHIMTAMTVTARYVGSGEYAGVLVSLLAVFALFNSWRGNNSPFSPGERRALWFWTGAIVFSLLAAWGRHGFFYRLLYHLPYISTIRNPIKFLHPFHIAWLILATYGMEALWRRYLQPGSQKLSAAGNGFEKKWIIGCAVFSVVSLAAFAIYCNSIPRLIYYLTQNGIDGSLASPIAHFSVTQCVWFLGLLLVSSCVIALIIRGGLSARRAWIVLGAILIFDLAAADIPWVHYFNYQEEYASNTIVDFFQDKPYEHRVSGRISPRGLGSGISSPMGQLYDYWQQNNFPYHGIQSLDFAQWSRIPALDMVFMKKFALHGEGLSTADLWPVERLWELTNTRFVLTFAEMASLVNKQADASHTCRVNMLLKVEPKPGLTMVEDAGDMTAIPDSAGPFALIESPNVLPRVKLYSHWQTVTNDDEGLDVLYSHDFNPHQSVVISSQTPVAQAPGDANADPGTAEIATYQPKYVAIQAEARRPAVLLFNDRVAPEWRAWVDGRPVPILRCNHLMRGVFLTSGQHKVEFRFRPSLTALYVSLGAWGIGILTAGYVVWARAPKPSPTPWPSSAPVSTTSVESIPVSSPAPPSKTPSPQPESASRSKRRRKR